MKLLFVSIFFVTCLSVAFAGLAQYPVTKKTICNGGKCVDYCDFDGVYILKGNSYSKKETCSSVHCNSDYSMTLAEYV